MLQIDNLIYSYDGETNVINGASFKIEKGNIYCILGVNGAGKTTLFNCITGFYPSNISIDKEILNEKIIYIHDQMDFYKTLTGDEFVNLILNLKEKSLNIEVYNSLVDELKMNDKTNKLISTYSLGTKQKLVLIISFLLEYEYILMDEPFGSLDFISAEVIINTMKKCVMNNCSIVISTHLIDIAQEISDTILFLNNGKIYEIENTFKTPSELKSWIKGLI
ncbi:multidrug ABC transporter ATPase [Clostridium putrefaciens]|uniref:Multidrug ABC transporter ATPase n=1 Tax=Clostridium putrefaciens TaxID=99675 RepID=A0A381JCA6_9CLOT|nr:ABC transporter ATP-binding protein [Clostridium putrefaciens]SUY48056.1 multidrug ABC transporter ATPase [Clostridium putrefaciens]